MIIMECLRFKSEPKRWIIPGSRAKCTFQIATEFGGSCLGSAYSKCTFQHLLKCVSSSGTLTKACHEQCPCHYQINKRFSRPIAQKRRRKEPENNRKKNKIWQVKLPFDENYARRKPFDGISMVGMVYCFMREGCIEPRQTARRPTQIASTIETGKGMHFNCPKRKPKMYYLSRNFRRRGAQSAKSK